MEGGRLKAIQGILIHTRSLARHHNRNLTLTTAVHQPRNEFVLPNIVLFVGFTPFRFWRFKKKSVFDAFPHTRTYR